MKKSKINLAVGVSLILAFALWTLLVRFVDVAEVGPRGSYVGFSHLNTCVHSLTEVHMTLYVITDWLGLVPIFVAFGFGVFGLVQWIKRKSFIKVDFDILALGVFYIAVMAVYVLFEYVVVNYRPVLINGYLEVSYPSSTTMLVMTVMPSCAMQICSRVKRNRVKIATNATVYAFVAFMVLGRLISGVHWVSDIIGGALISAGLVMVYGYFQKSAE